MDVQLVAQCVVSGILAGNEILDRWTGGEWVCERGGLEYLLTYGVAEQCHQHLSGWRVWPETKADEDFTYIMGRKYRELGLPEKVFGGVRYDVGLLRGPHSVSALVEIKRYWTTEDLLKIALALFHLGVKPEHREAPEVTGVALESVFFGCFVWREPTASDPMRRRPLRDQYKKMKEAANAWWQQAKWDGSPVQQQFREKYGSSPQPQYAFSQGIVSGRNEKAQWGAGAACVYLSLK